MYAKRMTLTESLREFEEGHLRRHLGPAAHNWHAYFGADHQAVNEVQTRCPVSCQICCHQNPRHSCSNHCSNRINAVTRTTQQPQGLLSGIPINNNSSTFHHASEPVPQTPAAAAKTAPQLFRSRPWTPLRTWDSCSPDSCNQPRAPKHAPSRAWAPLRNPDSCTPEICN